MYYFASSFIGITNNNHKHIVIIKPIKMKDLILNKIEKIKSNKRYTYLGHLKIVIIQLVQI